MLAQWITGLPLLLLAQHWDGVNAWGVDAHKRIAQMAESIFTDRQKVKVQEEMNGTLVEYADWERKIYEHYNGTDVLHWHRQQPEWNCRGTFKALPKLHLGDTRTGKVRCETFQGGAEEDSLFCVTLYFFEHFTHDALLDDFPAPDPPVDGPVNVPPLRPAKVDPAELTPPKLLRGLVSLIADLHQPLHWLKENHYGNDIDIKIHKKDFTLLTLFEDYIPTQLPPPPTAAELQKKYAEVAPAWFVKNPKVLFREWSEEISQVLCKEIMTPLGPPPRRREQLHLPDKLFDRWSNLVQNMTTWASLRIAFVLNDVVEHHKHRQLAHKEGRGHHYHAHRQNFLTGSAMTSLGLNVAIAGGVVPLLMGIFMWHFQHAELFIDPEEKKRYAALRNPGPKDD